MPILPTDRLCSICIILTTVSDICILYAIYADVKWHPFQRSLIILRVYVEQYAWAEALSPYLFTV